MTEYFSESAYNLFDSKVCRVSYKIDKTRFATYAQDIVNIDRYLFMAIDNYYSCRVNFTLDTDNSALVITLTKVSQ